MPAFKYPRESIAIGWEDSIVSLSPTQIWEADDPLVKARPELFVDEPVGAVIRSTSKKKAPPADVEQATAAPGEKRATKRAAK